MTKIGACILWVLQTKKCLDPSIRTLEYIPLAVIFKKRTAVSWFLHAEGFSADDRRVIC